MRISEHGKVVLLLAALADLARGQNQAGVLDARQIMESSIAATERHWQVRLRYTYTEREESRRRDQDGRVKSEDVTVSRTILVNGIPFEHVEEHNGKPPPVEEERRQKQKLDKLKQESPDQRTERLRKQAEENASLIREVPKAFDFRLVGEESVDGRAAYILQATPHPGYQPQGKYGKMFPKVEGRLWVDKQDHGWIKVDGQVIQPIAMGLFLARVLRGSHIVMEQMRVDEGIWMPKHIEVRAAAKILLVKNLVIERVLTYSEYKLP